ncbi:hypothetical protein BJV78DRAFT_1254344 [Lactifluus subvellereus]|nr:hypothetical protein BJV78DRAFT_1254344 [Lactifluus subvellereus]
MTFLLVVHSVLPTHPMTVLTCWCETRPLSRIQVRHWRENTVDITKTSPSASDCSFLHIVNASHGRWNGAEVT